jgi:hypothetical protein
MMGLTFEPLAHRYTLDGVVVPSVTGVLQRSGLIDFSSIPPTVLEAARVRGTVVHTALHFINDGDLDIEQFYVDFAQYAGYVQAWVAFCAQRNFVPVLNEHRIASRRHQVAGTLDCLGTLDGVGVLLDFATGRAVDAAKNLQTAAYHGLALEWAREDPPLAEFFAQHPFSKRYAVELRKDATFTLEAYTEASDFREFLTLRSALAIVEKYRGAPAAVEV